MPPSNTKNDQNKAIDNKPQETSLLSQIGLSEKESTVYQVLLKLGKVPASRVVDEVGQKRSTVYSILEELIKKGLVEKDESAAVDKYRARHPYSLKQYIETQVEQIKKADNQLEAALPSFINLYNQSQNRPGVKFYEGLEGVKKVMDDSLNSKTEILTIADIEAVREHIYEINEAYIKKRNKKAIPKRLLVQDTPYSRERIGKYSDKTNAKLFKLEIDPFSTVMQIYDGKIVYLNLTKDFYNGIIIQDPYLYSTHKALFNFIWKQIPASA
jgi:HTH-type transcriptional regulator, sugar sensing transcriptional regulator